MSKRRVSRCACGAPRKHFAAQCKTAARKGLSRDVHRTPVTSTPRRAVKVLARMARKVEVPVPWYMRQGLKWYMRPLAAVWAVFAAVKAAVVG